ncbi:4597_t:CDS:2 [Funneliformis geosporum]|uniref:4597_t:CDS:1 n=1 Tax=Funneliformis geosporum TaxID=1117311 RepID=A0A9W4X0T7_9GLOM|nr:4597_t:CDS:2 [Funneliformis geosporum]
MTITIENLYNGNSQLITAPINDVETYRGDDLLDSIISALVPMFIYLATSNELKNKKFTQYSSQFYHEDTDYVS